MLPESCLPQDVFCRFYTTRTKTILMPLWCWLPDSLPKCKNKQTLSRPHVPSFFPINGVLEARLSSRHDKEESNALTLIIQLPSRIQYLDFHTLLTASAVYHWMLTVINSGPISGAVALIKSSLLVRRCTNQRQAALDSQSSDAQCC